MNSSNTLKRTFTILALFFLTAFYSMAEPPEPPLGKVWVLVPGMSDEFDANSPDKLKWNVFDIDDTWPRTSSFDKRIHEAVQEPGTDNYYLAMNPIWYYEDERFNMHNRTYKFAGGGMDTWEMATYGYFEVRIKPSNFPMGSGVFMNSRRTSSEDCNTKYATELDIIENMSYDGPGANKAGFNYKMNVNSHAKPFSFQNGSCQKLPFESTKSGVTSPALEGALEFNTVGMWWKNEQEAQFYHNNKAFGTIVPKRNFNLPMPVIIVMETYSWGSEENNAGNPKPVEYMFKDNFRTKDERAVLYDWVRTWKLVNINTSDFNSSKNNIRIYQPEEAVYPGTNLIKNIIYSSTKTGTVDVSIKDKLGNTLVSKSYPANTGVKSINADLQLSSALVVGEEYTMTVTLKDGSNTLSSDTKILTVVEKPLSNQITSALVPDRLAPANSYTIQIPYEADEPMEVGGEVRDPNNKWIGGGTSEIVEGKGVVDITINLTEPTNPAAGYYFKLHLKPAGTGWQDAVFALGNLPFTVANPIDPSLKITSAILSKEDNKHIINVDFSYGTEEDVDLELLLLDSNGQEVARKNGEERIGERSLNREIFVNDLLPGGEYTVVLRTTTKKSKMVLMDTFASKIVIPETILSTSLEDLDQGPVVFPNPFKETVSLTLANGDFDAGDIQVYDLMGRAYQPQINKIQGSELELDLSQFKSGIYILRVTKNNEFVDLKLIKE